MDALWSGVRFPYLLEMTLIVGGQPLLAATLVPVERNRGDGRPAEIGRRFGSATVVAGSVLVATGAAQARHL